MKNDTTIIDEKSRFNLRFDNVWAVLISIALFAFSVGVYYAGSKNQEMKLDMIIAQQKDLSLEFREWRKQAETRLGTVESRQGTVMSFLKTNFNIDIK